MAKVGVIDTTNSGNSRLEHLAKSDEHIVRLKGEYVADAVITLMSDKKRRCTEDPIHNGTAFGVRHLRF